MSKLNNTKVAVLATHGFEDSELTVPWQVLESEGAEVFMIAPEPGEVSGKNGHTQAVDAAAREANAEDFDALVLPGGTSNADHLRMDDASVKFTRDFFDAGKSVSVICHGAWILTDADVLKGRTVTSFPSLKTDLKNAGATWVDEEVVTDQGLVSSRTPDDLPAFTQAMVQEIVNRQSA